MSRISKDAAPGGGVTAAVLEKAASTPNTDVLSRHAGEFEAVSSGRSKFSISPDMVKGSRGPDDKPADFDTISARRQVAEKTFLASIRKGLRSPEEVVGGLSPMFGGPLGSLITSNPYTQLAKWAQTIDKSFELSSPLGSGLVPYDLVAPTLLIYPVFSPLRNRIPRPQGQGKSHQAKVLTSVLGSQPGVFANPSARITISELPGGGSLSTWPNQLPGAGSQTAVTVNIPYKFFGLTEAVSWLAQFAGQGFDDIAALASLVLLQETMLAEERAIIGATGYVLTTPGKPTLSAKTAGTGETALTGVNTNVYVRVTVVNYYGETKSGTVVSVAATDTDVVNVVLPSMPEGGLAFNIYVGTGTADPGVSGSHLMASYVGGVNYTLQGKIPTTTATPPTADTGTHATTDYEGIVSILSGHAAANAGTGYPTDYKAGYYDGSVGTTLSVDVISNALREVYNGSTKSYFADPAEIWGEATDIKNLSLSLADTSGDLNYTVFVQQDQVSNVIAGMAVSQFANPVTRSTVKMTVHPYFPQGTAAGLSYTLPQVQTNVSNVWENVMVQDYISINWPVIDVTFRYSLFFYGTLWSPAPQYNFMLQGLQRNASAPYS